MLVILIILQHCSSGNTLGPLSRWTQTERCQLKTWGWSVSTISWWGFCDAICIRSSLMCFLQNWLLTNLLFLSFTLFIFMISFSFSYIIYHCFNKSCDFYLFIEIVATWLEEKACGEKRQKHLIMYWTRSDYPWTGIYKYGFTICSFHTSPGAFMSLT